MNTYEDDVAITIPLGFESIICFGQTFIVLCNGRIETRRNNFKIVFKKVIEGKYISVKELNKRLERHYTVTRFLFKQMNSNLASGQPSSVGDNFDSYAIKIDKLVRIIGLLESNLNQYFNK